MVQISAHLASAGINFAIFSTTACIWGFFGVFRSIVVQNLRLIIIFAQF
jgi:hypothetical protein